MFYKDLLRRAQLLGGDLMGAFLRPPAEHHEQGADKPQHQAGEIKRYPAAKTESKHKTSTTKSANNLYFL